MLSKDNLVLIGTMILENRTSREIREIFMIGNGNLTRFRKALQDGALTPETMRKMDEAELRILVYGSAKTGESGKPAPHFEEIYERLKNRNLHMTLKVEWMTYKAAHPEGYQYSHFCNLYRQWEKKVHPGASATAPIRRNPGEFMYIDWVGDTPAMVRDPDNPEKKLKVHVLVTTLGVSSKTFAIALPDEKTPRFLHGMNQAVAFYGALPRYFRPDNMKTAVTSNTPDGLVLSTAMEDVQDYYDTPVLPARPLSPKDKATVERAVEIIEKEFLAPMSTTVFENFGDLNQSLSKFLDELNSRIKKPENRSRNDIFNAIDRPAMRELTQEPFQVREIIRRKVGNNCHVLHNGYYYSVPYEYVEENVILKVSSMDIIICNSHNEKIAEHNLGLDERKRYITNPFHLPSQHQAFQEMAEYQAEDYLKKAGMIGPKTRRFCELIQQRSAYPEQEYRRVSGVIHFCDNKPRDIMERAADYALNHGKIGLNHFKKAYESVKNSPTEQTDEGVLPEHPNLRGKGYYR